MICKEIQELINKQINAELWSAFLYLSMSVDARHRGTCGVANWLFIQAREELDHSRILQNYLIAQGVKIRLKALPDVPIEWESTVSVLNNALSHEREVTSMINNIVQEAQARKDYATLSMIMWFVDEQTEEEQVCTDLLQLFVSAKDDPCLLYQLDQKLLKRKYAHPRHNHAEHWIA